MSEYILEMKDITKEFPGVKALDRVSFKVRAGEIHCLVGENGAGKSTLMKVLSGIHQYGTYTGSILLDGKEMQFHSIRESEQAGIAIINQELALIPDLSIAENIYFGHELMKGRLVDWNRTIIESAKILKRVRLNVNPRTKISDISIGRQQLVEIAKALSKNARLIILDEPTSSLNEDDSENLLQLLRELKAEGVTLIMISHRLKEVVEIADTVTVLRDGMTICSMDASGEQITENEIIRHMVGREINDVYPKRTGSRIGDVRFEIRNWTVYDPASGREILHNVNLNVRRGEIVGLSGLMGAGRTELALSIFGNRPGYQIRSGELYLDGKEVHFATPKDAIEAGVSYATEDRKRNGLILIQDIMFNVSLANLGRIENGKLINQNEEIIQVERLKEEINIKAPSIKQKVLNLSGGNQQKVALGKWIFSDPGIMILDEPTRGIDVGAKFEIYTLMNEMVMKGMSIIMISSELLEILGMSDRIYVMSEGHITGELSAEEATEQKIMRLSVNSKEA